MAPKSRVALAVANLLIPIAILIFASGFFPYKPFLPGMAEYETGRAAPPKAPYDKVIFMVVDALRSDFVYSENSAFAFTQGLISNGAAIPFTAHATSPTITMPRVKAITTGSIPSFLDVILNFAESDTLSTLASQDSWLAQMKAKGAGKAVMYGDDTWLKLFPETFDRADGTTSFFVSDFAEVDSNVTRHIPRELHNGDWNTMVLHYLGLDHIGHKAGPRSPNMLPKQKEMDGIVELVYTAMASQKHLSNTLLVLCGDHGMSESGNHGGSSAGETSPALVFISPKLGKISSGFKSPLPPQNDFHFYNEVEQSDIAPTLGGLLGFPVPKNNLGTFIVDFLPFWPAANDKLQILLGNARQIWSVFAATFPAAVSQDVSRDCSRLSSDAEKLNCDWRAINARLDTFRKAKSEDHTLLLQALSKWSKDAQRIMSSTASNYDLNKLVGGQIVAFISTALAALYSFPILRQAPVTSTLFGFMATLYGIMMFASSYVEEEHNFWYWAASGWMVIIFTNSARRESSAAACSVLVVLFGIRVARRWNQSGQKFVGEPDIAHSFLSRHATFLWVSVLAMYIWNCYSLGSSGFPHLPRKIARAISQILMLLAVTFKLAFTHEDAPELLDWAANMVVEKTTGWSLLLRARAVYIGFALALGFVIIPEFATKLRRHRFNSSRTIHNLIVILLMTQSRATNIPLFIIFSVQSHLLYSIDLTLVEITTTSILMQGLSFFAFGGTNSISSVDLSSAYNGVSGYNIIVVGLLTFISNWAGPIFWASATTRMLLRLRAEGEKEVLRKHLTLLTAWVAAGLLFVMVACTVLRTHLFIWTVFSPKYLYIMAWDVGQHLAINIGLGSLLFWLAIR